MKGLPDTYDSMKKYAFRTQIIFESTYVCEKFCNMIYITNRFRTRLGDNSLQPRMKMTSNSSHVQRLCAEMQEQKSH